MNTLERYTKNHIELEKKFTKVGFIVVIITGIILLVGVLFDYKLLLENIFPTFMISIVFTFKSYKTLDHLKFGMELHNEAELFISALDKLAANEIEEITDDEIAAIRIEKEQTKNSEEFKDIHEFCVKMEKFITEEYPAIKEKFGDRLKESNINPWFVKLYADRFMSQIERKINEN